MAGTSLWHNPERGVHTLTFNGHFLEVKRIFDRAYQKHFYEFSVDGHAAGRVSASNIAKTRAMNFAKVLPRGQRYMPERPYEETPAIRPMAKFTEPPPADPLPEPEPETPPAPAVAAHSFSFDFDMVDESPTAELPKAVPCTVDNDHLEFAINGSIDLAAINADPVKALAEVKDAVALLRVIASIKCEVRVPRHFEL